MRRDAPVALLKFFSRTTDERLPIKQLWGPSLAREAGRGDAVEVAKGEGVRAI